VELEAAENARLQAASNLDKYHKEIKTCRDKKVLRKKSTQAKWCSFIISTNRASGTFVVANMVKPGVYRLLNEEGVETSHTWNADNLCRFYP
jgi:hypothetical protein